MPSRRQGEDLLGVPFAPAAPATRAVNALRRGLGRARRAPVPGSVRVLDGLFGLFDNRVLGLLVELGVPDHLDRPRTTEEPAAATGADAGPVAASRRATPARAGARTAQSTAPAA